MSDADTNIQRCPALRKDGTPCRAKATATGWCVGHDPQSAAWRVTGGAHTTRASRADKLLPARLRPVADGLMRAFAGVEAGTFDLKRAACMAALASALVRVVQAGETEERLRALERRAHDEEQRLRGGDRRGTLRSREDGFVPWERITRDD